MTQNNTTPKLKRDLKSSYLNVMQHLNLEPESFVRISCNNQLNNERWLKWDIQLNTVPYSKFIEFIELMVTEMANRGHSAVYAQHKIDYFRKYGLVPTHLEMVVQDAQIRINQIKFKMDRLQLELDRLRDLQ